MSSDGPRPDVVIAGSGIAGLVAAVALVDAGASVLLIEKEARLGGSTRISGGTVWTAASMASMRGLVPGGDRRRQAQLVEGIEDGLDWLAANGVEVAERRRTDDRVIAQVDPIVLVDRLAARVVAAGSTVAAATRLVGVDTDVAGAVTGVALDVEGERRTVPTGAVILATGGFQADRDLLARHVPGETDRLMLRAAEGSTGDGLRIATEVGGGCSPDMASFYGHTMPELPKPLPPDDWTSVTPYYTQDAVLVDVTGRRFFDESTSMADERAPMALVRCPGGRGVLILDDALYRDEDISGRSYARVGASFDAAARAGARHVTTSSLEELADEVADWGVDASQLLDTLRRYNEAVAEGRGADLSPPRLDHQIPVSRPPFRALEVRPAITFTLGGIAVDLDGRVLPRGDDGHLDGLYAIGADAGGIYEGGYAGGLALGLVQGRRVAATLRGS